MKVSFFYRKMNSKFRLTTSSEEVNVDVGVPGIQKLSSDKLNEELRYEAIIYSCVVNPEWFISGLAREKHQDPNLSGSDPYLPGSF